MQTPAGARGDGGDAGTRGGDGARRALIVDDDPDVAETMGDALEQAGLPATIAHTGAEAIRIAGDAAPGSGLLRRRAGKGLSGYDVARALRADPRLRDATLIAVTGLPADQCAAAATAAGFDHVLTKPVDLDRLEELRRKPGPRTPTGESRQAVTAAPPSAARFRGADRGGARPGVSTKDRTLAPSNQRRQRRRHALQAPGSNRRCRRSARCAASTDRAPGAGPGPA